MVDDLLTISRCGTASLALNTYVNAQIETKKLKFHTPDANGKSKCHVLHIGKIADCVLNYMCMVLKFKRSLRILIWGM